MDSLKLEIWKQGLSLGQVMHFVSQGSSMSPSIRPGDTLSISPRSPIRIGDIVLVPQGDSLILHRLVAKFKGRIFTKADMAARLDKPAAVKDILGVAILRNRRGITCSLVSLKARYLGSAFSVMFFLVKTFIIMAAKSRRLLYEKNMWGEILWRKPL